MSTEDEIGPTDVGARIRQARKSRGLTQATLAAAVGVSRSAVAQWETERAGQVRGNLTRIASVLGVSVEFLLAGRESGLSGPENATELALLRIYRTCTPEDQAFLLRTARRLARAAQAESERAEGDVQEEGAGEKPEASSSRQSG